VPRATARDRYRRLTALQQGIMESRLKTQVGSEERVLIDAVLGRDRAIGRASSQAPEIDGVVHLHTEGPATVGEFRAARITGVRDIDLVATA
jgi:ribosomal protein S12 methylthiotransferase